jgi:hypothetical protein
MSLLLSLVAALAFGQSGPQKTTLENGATLYAERVEARGFTLHFFASNGGAPEDGTGARHLLEHILANSPGLDEKLELKGLSLSADTTRDGIRFEIEGNDALLAISALKDFVNWRTVTQEEIDKEARVIAQERPVRSNATLLASGLWKQAFNEPDIMGEQDQLAKTTPEKLRQVFDSHFRPERMSVAIVGDIDQVECIEAMRAIVAPLKQVGTSTPAQRNVVEQTNRGVVPGASGVGRAVLIGSSSRAESLAVLAAALAIANETPGAQVVNSVTPIGGLVCIVHPSRDGLDDVDRMVTSESARLYTPGLTAVRLWAATTQGLTREKARAYGQMLAHESYFRMEDLVSRAGLVSQSDFMVAMNKFRTGACVQVGGVR